jgi:hypothetical protein
MYIYIYIYIGNASSVDRVSANEGGSWFDREVIVEGGFAPELDVHHESDRKVEGSGQIQRNGSGRKQIAKKIEKSWFDNDGDIHMHGSDGDTNERNIQTRCYILTTDYMSIYMYIFTYKYVCIHTYTYIYDIYA